MAILIDTCFLLALAAPRDHNNHAARDALIGVQKETLIVTTPVLPELFYMVTKRVGYSQAMQNFSLTQRTFQIEDLTELDMHRMQEIMRQYQDAEFDFVDTSIMAVAERLNIKQICTFDHRDFSIFRPKHCDYLELLPK